MTLQFQETTLAGAYVVRTVVHEDERGSFARTFDARELEARGLESVFVEGGTATNHAPQTLRGMHWQRAPWQEAKLVRCVRGALFDVLVDLRRDSSTWRQWFAIELSDARTALFVPQGMAHGYLTLTPDTEVNYLISQPYKPEAATGFRWDDPAVGIEWPSPPEVISTRDRSYPPLI